MNIYPAQAAAVQAAMAYKLDDFPMRDQGRLMHVLVSGQQLGAASRVANEQFSINQLVPRDGVYTYESLQLGRVGRAVGKEPSPNGSVHQDHFDVFCLAGGFSRRRGTSRASGSEPRKARR